jgi:hypothetical protein
MTEKTDPTELGGVTSSARKPETLRFEVPDPKHPGRRLYAEWQPDEDGFFWLDAHTKIHADAMRHAVEAFKRKKTRVLEDLRVDSVALVDHCIYCGSKNFDEPGVHPTTGETCHHPNRVHRTEPAA